jgi:asparagine synthase (glutamine-hydrolysing)
MADLSALGLLALSDLAARHVTVALSGQGADELLGGYERYRSAAIAGAWHKVPRVVRAAPAAITGRAFPELRRRSRILNIHDPAERFLAVHSRIDKEQRADLVHGHLAELDGDTTERFITSRLDGLETDPLSTLLFLDAQLGLPDDMLHYFDRASMAHSLEIRVPFLDHHLVEYCARIPSRLKLRRLTTKHLLKLAARGLVPDRVIDKPKIGFFHRSMESWLDRQAASAIGAYLLSESPRYGSFLSRDEVRRLLARRDELDSRGHHLVFGILVLEIWLSEFLPHALGNAGRDYETSAPQPVRAA